MTLSNLPILPKWRLILVERNPTKLIEPKLKLKFAGEKIAKEYGYARAVYVPGFDIRMVQVLDHYGQVVSTTNVPRPLGYPGVDPTYMAYTYEYGIYVTADVSLDDFILQMDND
jgi:hypothetical protein